MFPQKATAATLSPTEKTRPYVFGIYAKCAVTTISMLLQEITTELTLIIGGSKHRCYVISTKEPGKIRYEPYPKVKYSAHPKDCSVMTYRGHAVLRTLIRCYFSPSETTGGQYLYSGSADGKIHV